MQDAGALLQQGRLISIKSVDDSPSVARSAHALMQHLTSILVCFGGHCPGMRTSPTRATLRVRWLRLPG